jgi:hypothetical protein
VVDRDVETGLNAVDRFEQRREVAFETPLGACARSQARLRRWPGSRVLAPEGVGPVRGLARRPCTVPPIGGGRAQDLPEARSYRDLELGPAAATAVQLAAQDDAGA